MVSRATTVLLLLLALPHAATAGERLDEASAAALLSRYPAGSVPIEPATMTAIHVLGERGTRAEISLLRNLAEHERDEVRTAAVASIQSIRDRQRTEQRATFAESLPRAKVLADRAEALVRAGLAPTQAQCVAYTEHMLGGPEVEPGRPTSGGTKGDPARMLAEGRPARAVALLASDPSAEARRLEAQAWEDLGEPRTALRRYAALAARGDEAGHEALATYGIDEETLLLGLLAHPQGYGSGLADAELVEALVRQGDALTVRVLAERAQRPLASDRVVSVDALARMLQGEGRSQPLSASAATVASEALWLATKDRVESIRVIAREAL